MGQRRYRFHAGPPAADGFVTLDGRQSHHARDVLRLKPGDRIHVFTDAGMEWPAVITETAPGRVVARTESSPAAPPALPIRITCAAACPKGRRIDFMLQKLCELGMAAWIPLISRRSQPVPSAARMDRLKTILLEAAKQCGRTDLPAMLKPARLEQLCAAFADYNRVYVASPSARVTLLSHVGTWTAMPERVLVLIGPEGGFTDEEMGELTRSGAVPISLGLTTLRIETAALAAMSVLSQRGAQPWNRESIS